MIKHPAIPVLMGIHAILHDCDARGTMNDSDFILALETVREQFPEFQPIHGYDVQLERNHDELLARAEFMRDTTPYQRLKRTFDQFGELYTVHFGSKHFMNDLVDFAHANPGVQLFNGLEVTPTVKSDGTRGATVLRSEVKPVNIEMNFSDSDTVH